MSVNRTSSEANLVYIERQFQSHPSCIEMTVFKTTYRGYYTVAQRYDFLNTHTYLQANV